MNSPTDQTDGIPGMAAASTASAAPNDDQKRTCTNDAHEEPEGKKRRVAEAEEDSKPPAVENGMMDGADGENHTPACYICFNAKDEAGELAVRDCSCRGGAGFAHKGCIVKFAKMNHDDKDGDKFIEMWRDCPQCKQPYQGDLAIHLANEAVAYVEGRPPSSRECHLMDQLLALSNKLYVIDMMPREDQNREMEGTTNKIFAVVDEVKKLANASSFDEVTILAEAEAYLSLGMMSLDVASTTEAAEAAETKAKDALDYLVKSRDRLMEVGQEQVVAVTETMIVAAKQKLEGKNPNSLSGEHLKRVECLYKESKKEGGEGNAGVIQTGLSLAYLYQKASPTGNNPIKAERLLANLVDATRRVHGVDHGLTRMATSALKSSKKRYVLITSGDEQKKFQALRYEGGRTKIVVQGPMEQPRNADSKTLIVSSDEVVYKAGTPVICHGFGYLTRSNREIDGKIGVAQSWDGKRDSYEICFEDEGLEPRWVKRENVRILFELP